MVTAVADGTVPWPKELARAYAEAGLERGDRVVVQLPNTWPFVVLTLACLRAGIVPVMALPARRRHELAYLPATKVGKIDKKALREILAAAGGA
jgi:non-ribosomal peptide synthetase component E (peptide arylation enzyme)